MINMNTETRIIKGHYILKLVPEKYYRISYGVNQGIYKYLGQETEGFWKGASIFENIINHKQFNYYGLSSPYEFTGIVNPINESEIDNYIEYYKQKYPEDYA